MALSKCVLLSIISIVLLARNGLAENCKSFKLPSSCHCNVTNDGTNLYLYCMDGDLSQLVWDSSLNEKLVKLVIVGVETGLLSFVTRLPELPKLQDLTFENCANVELPDPSKVAQLRKLSLASNKLTNEQITKILAKWTSLSIEAIQLNNNKLVVYPSLALNEMPKLSNVSLRNNEIKALRANHSMKFNVLAKMIDLSDNQISEIVDSTTLFQGNFKEASLSLDGNPILEKPDNAHVLRKMATTFNTISIGTLNCSSCFIAEIGGKDFKLIANERITGQCDDDYFVFKYLTREVYKSRCSSSASGSRNFSAVIPLLTMPFSIVVASLLMPVKTLTN